MEPLTRQEKLRVLASMGLELPDGTKLVDDILDKRLRNALDAAQEKDRIPEPSKLQDLPSWPLLKIGELDTRARPLLEAVKRGTIHEARQNSQAALMGMSAQPALFTDPFMDLRQTVMSLANVLDNGFSWCMIQDPDRENLAINIRFLKVYEIDENAPAILLLYHSFSRANALDGARWCQYQVDSNPRNLGGMGMNISATALEQKLLLQLLRQNGKLLPADFQPERKRFEENYRASVLLPVGPLGFAAIAKLTNDAGCEVCGKRGALRCSQCQSASYCSKECQKVDWPSHKQTCRSLKGGRWATVAFQPTPPGAEGMYIANLNHHTSTARILADGMASMRLGSADTPHPNAHGARPFLVKIQLGITGGSRDTMMVYDRQRSFSQVWVARGADPGAFADLVAEMAGPRGGYGGVKMYRWARRTGDWELSICVDRKPETDIKW